jgi:hypothetical protein
LVLVFLGLLVSAFESYDREGKSAARPKFAPAARASMTAFLIGLVAIVLALGWLLGGRDGAFYVPLVVAFLVDVVLVGYIAVSVVQREFRKE